ncbi:Flp pilus assembly protein CpaB [Mesobacillus harenae]|uniref:Flp pilus assembly protein CpaB n=1 Tax=Mesobacillus harenae TaxID=2213203 RepID=UPI001580C2A1|nr:Flp pilus assembly protein CpaB [Mesobacillus harenae]
MNTKKIWVWSLALGMMVAALTYITFFSKQPATVASNVQVQELDKTDEPVEEEEVEPDYTREILNPMVEISKGKRAISINVDVSPGVSGYVEPESKVDVVAYESVNDEEKDKDFKSAVLVLENVKVLASGISANTKEQALLYQTVTLEVTPEEGLMLSLASKDKDGFYLMLRNDEDTETGKQGLKETREIFKERKEKEAE